MHGQQNVQNITP